eukprot:scaffold2520_cov103-Cylindrotheca_fusiformis.AAC.1
MVNFTSRHESTGAPGKIHCSSDLFCHLKSSSASSSPLYNFKARGLVDMKGKGEHYTYWLESATGSNTAADPRALQALSADAKRMITSQKWKMRRYFEDEMSNQLVHRSHSRQSLVDFDTASIMSSSSSIVSGDSDGGAFGCGLDDSLAEFKEELHFVWSDLGIDQDISTEEVQSKVVDVLLTALTACVGKGGKRLQKIETQLLSFVEAIANGYRNRSKFHSFRSATDVLLKADFLWQRLAEHKSQESCDPWDQFVLLFAVLIHDMDHTGVPNSQLVAEGDYLVQQYKQKGAYQQRSSVDSAMEILEDDFGDLYDEIMFGCPRFRKSVKDLVLLDADMESEPENVISRLHDVLERPSGDGRLSRQRTEAIIGLTFILATVGHYCQAYDVFLRQTKIELDSEMEAFLAGRSTEDPRPKWHDVQALAFEEKILPLLDA